MVRPALVALVCAPLISAAPLARPAQARSLWEGIWVFDESWEGPSPEMRDILGYQLTITANGQAFDVDLDMDGFQTQVRLRAKGEVKDGCLVITCLGPREGHGFPSFDPGKVLLELKRERGKVLTVWRALQPALKKHKKPGIYFKK